MLWGGVIWRKLYHVFSLKAGCSIHHQAAIGKGLRLPHPMGIVISRYAIVGDYCTIYHNVTIGADDHKLDYKKAPCIGSGVYIGAGATIIGDITIGDNAIIGANATITKDVPMGVTVVANNRIVDAKIERNPHPHFHV